VTPPAVTEASYQLGATARTFTYDAWTYTTSDGSTCNLSYVATLPSTPTGLSKDDSARSFTIYSATAADAGSYTISVAAVTPQGTTITTGTLAYPLKVRTTCDPPASWTPPTTTEQIVPIQATATTFVIGAFTSSSPSGCTFTYALDIPAALSAAVTFAAATRTVTVNSSDGTLAGRYTLTMTALSETGDALAGGNNLALQVLQIGDGSTTDPTSTEETTAKIQDDITKVTSVFNTVANVARNFVRPGNLATGNTALGSLGISPQPAGGVFQGPTANSGQGASTFDSTRSTGQTAADGFSRGTDTRAGGTASTADPWAEGGASRDSTADSTAPGMNSFAISQNSFDI